MAEITVGVGEAPDGEDEREAERKAEMDADVLIRAAEVLEDAQRHRRALDKVRERARAVDRAEDMGGQEVTRGA